MAVISNSAIAADLAVAGKKAKYDSYIKNSRIFCRSTQ